MLSISMFVTDDVDRDDVSIDDVRTTEPGLKRRCVELHRFGTHRAAQARPRVVDWDRLEARRWRILPGKP